MIKYRIFSDIQFIEGYNRFLIFDGLRNVIHFSPIESTKKILENNHTFTQENELFDFFLEKELIFELEEKFIDCFPRISDRWDSTFKVNSLVVYLSNETIILNKVWENHFRIGQLTFVLFDEFSTETINSLTKSFENIYADTIELTFTKKLSSTWIDVFLFKTSNIEKQFIINGLTQDNFSSVKYKKAFINSNISEYENINLSIENYFESKHFNPFFNHKIVIDENGYIKNDVNHIKHYGKLTVLDCFDNLLNVFESENFQQLWFTTKNVIEICSICEFRRNCIDKRTPVFNGSRLYYETECNYNPYISKWSHEDGYKTLEECGVISNDHEFSIDYEKIATINKELWEDE